MAARHPTDDVLDLAADFAVPVGYLDTATVGVPPTIAVGELQRAVAEWAAGRARPAAYDALVQRSRESFARIAGVPVEWVAVAAQVSYLVGLVAASLEPGSDVVSYRNEFTSLLFGLLQRAETDVRVRLVDVDDLAAAIEPATSLVAFSTVQSADGRVADVDAIAEAAERHGAMTLLDATQSCGWLPLEGSRFDFVCAGAYKWLLSPRGSAFMSVRPERLGLLRPTAPGWYAGERPWDSIYGPPLRLAAGARRLDTSPAWLSWVGTAPAMEYLETVGLERIHAHDVGLANRLREGLGLAESDSAIVSLALPDAAARLARAGVTAAARDGATRVAFHLYNTEADVDRMLRAAREPA